MQESIQPSLPSRDDIAVLAYQIWERSGRPSGQDVQFWLQAEQSLRPSIKPQPQSASQIPRPVPPPQVMPAAARLPGPKARKPASKPSKAGA